MQTPKTLLLVRARVAQLQATFNAAAIWWRPAYHEFLELIKRRRGHAAAAVLVMWLSVVLLQLIINAKFSSQTMLDADLNANREVAEQIAKKLKARADALDEDALLKQVRELSSVNPIIKVYLINQHGVLLAGDHLSSSVAVPFVDLKPVKAYLSASKPGLIYGDDPATFREQRPISVAPVNIGKELGYLYAVVGNRERGALSSFLFSKSILSMVMATTALTFVTILIVSLASIALLGTRLHAVNAAVAGLSHNLRTPLVSIQGYLETLLVRENQISAHDRRKYLTMVLSSANSLTQRVNSLFHLVELDAFDLAKSSECFAVSDLVNDLVILLKPKAEQSGFQLRIAIQPQLPQLLGNMSLISRAIQNILENAIRYTPKGGTIEIRCDTEGEKIVITVEDSGRGISKEEMSKIFTPYFRGSNVRDNAPGTGLGLAITKKIVELHSGTLRVFSSEGKGTIVVVMLGAAR